MSNHKNNYHHLHHAAKHGPLHSVNEWLEHFSHFVTAWSGSSWAFALAVLVILVWIITGPLFNYSDTWQLVINTGTTIITFLMVFLIQRSQNKESLAIHVKLNELLASQQGASNQLINAEDMSEEDIAELHEEFAELSDQLANAADDASSHSIAEARDAMARAKESLQNVRQSSEQRKKQVHRSGHGHR